LLQQEKKDRKLVPRWRDFQTTLALGELGIPKLKAGVADDLLISDKTAEWADSRTVWHAGDAISVAYAAGKEHEAQDVARFIVERQDSAPALLVRKAKALLESEHKRGSDDVVDAEEERIDSGIHEARTRLLAEPRNSILWVELARLYTLLALGDRAARAMRVACQLSPENRFVLRAASRFFLRNNEASTAQRLLRQAASTQRDPWLLAAELGIAAASGLEPQFVRPARRLLADDSISEFSKTELASALATLEFDNGKSRVGKQLIRSSLISPTENSVAQAVWAARHIGGLEVETHKLDVPRSFEARAYKLFQNLEWEAALRKATAWFKDQPFSSRPAIFASFISSSILEKYDQSIDILNASLRANPTDTALKNNLIFALINIGRLDEAEQLLRAIRFESVEPPSTVTLRATQGLLLFRRGFPDNGRLLYRDAMDEASRLGLKNYRALAAIFLAREELICRSDHSAAALKQAVEEAGKVPDEEVPYVLSRVLKLAEQTVRRA
jgi:Flp pilus assembly protein TadD